jgi:hypothetical protein
MARQEAPREERPDQTGAYSFDQLPEALRQRFGEALRHDRNLRVVWEGKQSPPEHDQSAWDIALARRMHAYGRDPRLSGAIGDRLTFEDFAAIAPTWGCGKGRDGDARHWKRCWDKSLDGSAQEPPEHVTEDAGLDGLDDEYAAREGKPNGPAATYQFAWLRDLKPNLTCNDLIKEILPAGGIGEVHADSGGGKSAIVVDMMLHLAAGLEYRSRRVVQTPVIYVALEGHGGIENRIIAAAAEIGIDAATVPFALIKASDNFRDPSVAAKLGATVALLGKPCVVVIDTYTAALGAGGNDCRPEDVTVFLENIKTTLITRKHTVLLLHHFGKDASRGGRGWSGLVAALDFEWEVDRSDDLRTLRVSKMRDGSDYQPALCYSLRGRQIGVDQHLAPVTAVVVEHLADEEPGKRKRYSPKARAVLNALWEMIKTPSRSFPLPDGNGLRCILLSDLEAECIKPGVISRCQHEWDRRRKFHSALDEIAPGALTIDGERVYPTPKDGGAPR